MKLLKLTDAHGWESIASQEDFDAVIAGEKKMLPLRANDGALLSSLPRFKRPSVCAMHPSWLSTVQIVPINH